MPTETRTMAGRNIRLAEAGPADAPLVVLLSPFPESILSFAGSWHALTEKCRVIAIDLPGFGASEGDRQDMSPSAQGAGLAAIFDELDLHNIHLVGPDVGMAAALAYVLNHKHRVASLAVGHGLGAPGPFKLAFMISMLAKFGGRAAEVVYWFKDFRAKAAELAGRVQEIEIPTLVFWGELDVLFDPSNAKHLDAALPQSKLHILPDAGHLAWADQPELFADMIIDWVATEHK